ncbi:MAG: DUF1934 domain-containing protein [Oscillospiraceae bacterium]|nr:DUF1934 domain-containing protein [Oscillospiraceae bacterium]
MKDVVISVKGIQQVNGQDDVVEMKTVGQMDKINGKIYLRYDDSVMLGVEGIKTTVKVQGNDMVVLQRSGRLQSRLMIERGQRHLCHYGTEHGDITIGVFGQSIINDLNEFGGELSMSYTIDINSSMVSRNEVKITVKEVG